MELYQQFFDEFENAVLVFDENNEIIAANQSFEKMLKLDADVKGKSLIDIFNENAVTKIETSTSNALIHTIVHQSSTLSFNVINTENLRYLLFHNYSGLTREVDRRKLEQSINLLGIMAKGIAHDFNNLLMAISGSLNLLILDSKNLSQNQRKYLFDAQKSLFQASGLVKQFQYLTREEVPRMITIDLFSAAKNVFSFLDRTSSKVVQKEINFDPNTVFVFADPVKMNQVILNLANNSIKAMADGLSSNNYIKISASPIIEADIQKYKLSDKYVHIVFEDNGVGIPDEMQDKIFLPFYTKDEEQGKYLKGLGLAIVYDIITRQFKGAIDLVSKPGLFTQMHIYLPQPDAKVSNLTIDSGDEELVGGIETILVADDENTVRSVLSVTLGKLGYKTLIAADGQECIDIFKVNMNQIALVLLDITMPKKSGTEVMNELLTIKPDVKVIISSGHTEEEIHSGILNLAQGHLNKPYERKQLAELIRKVIDTK